MLDSKKEALFSNEYYKPSYLPECIIFPLCAIYFYFLQTSMHICKCMKLPDTSATAFQPDLIERVSDKIDAYVKIFDDSENSRYTEEKSRWCTCD